VAEKRREKPLPWFSLLVPPNPDSKTGGRTVLVATRPYRSKFTTVVCFCKRRRKDGGCRTLDGIGAVAQRDRADARPLRRRAVHVRLGRGGAMIAFVVTVPSGQKRQVRFELPLPSTRRARVHAPLARSAHRHRGRALWEQACRQRWRALALVVKAKLEAVQSGIATFEDEFLAYTMLPERRDGQPVAGAATGAAYDPDRGDHAERPAPRAAVGGRLAPVGDRRSGAGQGASTESGVLP
jgi:hypothetical protein